MYLNMLSGRYVDKDNLFIPRFYYELIYDTSYNTPIFIFIFIFWRKRYCKLS